MDLLVRNAHVVTAGGEPESQDVLVEDGTVAAVGSNLEADPGTVLDADGKILLPALYDLHVHMREPGREDTETIETGSEAAVNGGITGVLAMPNTEPAVDSGSMVDFIADIAEDDARIDVRTAGCITKERNGEELAEIGDMKEKGAPMITDDGDPVADPQVMRRAMEYAKNFDLIVADHCEIPSLSGDGAVTEGSASYRLGLPSQPKISEEICVDRDLRLARLTGARYHVQHLSTAEGLRSVNRFREEGVRVSCEVTPHHLLFSTQDLEKHDTGLKMNPPLRSEEDRRKLVEGLEAGHVDAIATDHAPHAAFEKRQDFNTAPFGITGLETALVSLYDRLIQDGSLSWSTLAETFSRRPRELIGLPPVEIEEGNDAEFVLFDPESETTVDEQFLCSKSNNTPFFGETLQGRVQMVIRGENVLLDRDNRLTDERTSPKS